MKVTVSLYGASCFLGASKTKNGLETQIASTPFVIVTTGMIDVSEQLRASFVDEILRKKSEAKQS
jgi:hypothetical protein